jgi:hypothetical protein
MLAAALMSNAHGVAVTLAALGAVLFGLAAVRQHGAVQATMSTGPRGLRNALASFLKLVRAPSWLFGAVQAVVAGGLHILALALAPITLVQPIGVLAVPVTVVAAAVKAKRRPRGAQVGGSVLSVVGVVTLTLLLLTPTTNPFVLPSWLSLALTVAVAAGAGVAAIVGTKSRPLLRCVTLAATAAVLFGLNSILIRTIGHILTTHTMAADSLVLITAVVGIAVALPVGLWSVQTAYGSGSPQVVICCLTLLDPLAAVAGGNLLLHDGMVMTPFTIAAGIACALFAVVGVVFLSLVHPADVPPAVAVGSPDRGLATVS